MTYRLLLLPGDGIGPEIMHEAVKVLSLISTKYDLTFETREGLLGGAAIDNTGDPFPPETQKALQEVDAVLLAAIGGPAWENLPHAQKPESGLLRLRKELRAFANLRPVKIFDPLVDSSTLKKEVIAGIDLLVVRELTGGIYFGQPRGEVADMSEKTVANTDVYSQSEIRRIVRLAAHCAKNRSGRLCSVDKANVLEVSQFWREVTNQVISEEFPEIELSHMYVDNAAMQLIRNPRQFDVIVTSNLFGDILSDEASMLTGSIGMLPSACIGDGSKPGLYEPVHGSAPDIAGQGKANPIAMILSLAMLLKESFQLQMVASQIEKAVIRVLDQNCRTADLVKTGEKYLTTGEMGDQICSALKDCIG
ncbi:MAG: 3-isopropylmalate dehydrogenase [Candidatus Caenarcaniphilales bacterium]|nr:3-isopropylmalate dehydrogenase [Candidatus Caenarcaniphilales bacterium]